MQQEKEYQIIVSEENIPIIILKNKKLPPLSPLILYNEGAHAILYRRPDDAIMLDFIHPQVRRILKEAPFAIILERTPQGSDIANDYKAPIKKLAHNK